MDKNKKESLGKLHVMPQQYYLGTKRAVINDSSKKSAIKTGKFWIYLIIVIVLVGLLGVSGWLLYSVMTEPVQKAVVEQEINKTSPEDIKNKDIQDNSVVIEGELEDSSEQIDEKKQSIVNNQQSEDTVEKFEFIPGELNKFTLKLIKNTDSDKDGLTDEEEIILGLSQNKPDTDSDSYLDGAEFLNLYNPKDVEPAKLEFSGLVKTYINPSYFYRIFYPEGWLVKSIDQENKEVMFVGLNNEFVDVLIEENLDGKTLKEWYLMQVPSLSEADLVEFNNKQEMVGVESSDGFTVYFSQDNLIYIIHYNIGLKEKADYPNIFKMMIESFGLTEKSASALKEIL